MSLLSGLVLFISGIAIGLLIGMLLSPRDKHEMRTEETKEKEEI